VSRIDAEALADCSIIFVRLQRSYDRLVSSSCVAPRMSEHWQNLLSAAAHFTGQPAPRIRLAGSSRTLALSAEGIINIQLISLRLWRT